MKQVRPYQRFLILVIVFCQLIAVSTSFAAHSSQVTTTDELALDLLNRMKPEERVGQLFMIDFEGSRFTEESPLEDLITNYHIGGVNLKSANNNFTQGEDSLLDAWSLIQDIQRSEINNSRNTLILPATGDTFSPALVPLFIGIEQPEDGYPTNRLPDGLTLVPSEMAIGATWDKVLAQQAGEQFASEISSLGINFLLGPALNVHSNPSPELRGDLGINSFSGSPFWVGELGQAFITGLHNGSQNSLAVIAKNFPGYVGADQPLSDEIPTVRKTLDQLLNTELPPFFATTDLSQSPSAQVDGLLLTHARYEAFQSDVSAISPPITLNPQALSQLLSLQEFSNWHTNGGLVVSDELGSQAMRRYYIQLGQKYDPRLISRDALLSGSDLLLTGNFIAPDDPDLYTSIIRTLDFFAQKYRDDVAFAQQVDEAVLRILTLKYELYNNSFQETNILRSLDQLESVGREDQISFNVARKGATLVNPQPENLNTVLPNPPGSNDFITIFTDTIDYQACDTCDEVQSPSRTALEDIMLRLYGPSGDGLIVPGNVASYTYRDLTEAVDQYYDPESLVIANINRAEWLVFLQLDRHESRPESFALNRFLSETPELIQDKKIVVFGMDGPYYLNANEISTVTAYYNLYSKQPQFIEVAARLLFKELSTTGASPVSINSVGYVLEQALTPDITQIIPLTLRASVEPEPTEDTGTAEVSAPFVQGDSILLSAGPIVDNNGNPIRDGSVVQFTLVTTNVEGVSSQGEVTALTTDGFTTATVVLETAGTLQVQASSGQPPALSDSLQIDVISSGETQDPGEQEPPEPTKPAPTEIPEPEPEIEEPARELSNLVDWLLAIVVITFLSLFAYQFGALAGQVRWGVRWGLTSLIGGLAVNAYISFNLPGADLLIREYHIWGIVLGVAGGCLLGWAAGLLWRWLKK
jgi:beta-N-acetylhexosaminidase